jgi:3-oxoadipate enol-lactonase
VACGEDLKIEINDIELFYEEHGSPTGKTIVFIHGFPFNHEMWRPQIELLRSRYRVVAYDVRGHGQSAVGDGQYMIEFFVDDLISLLDHLRVERPILCGLSIGGYITLRAVERHLERFRAMILCDTSSEADTNEAKLKRAATVRVVKRDGVNPFAETFVKSVFAPETFAKKPETVQFIKRIIESTSPTGVSGTLLALAARSETTSSLSKMKIPTLIMVGEHDKLTPPSLSEMMHSKLPASELHLIPRAAHLSNLENPEEFNRHLSRFLENA